MPPRIPRRHPAPRRSRAPGVIQYLRTALGRAIPDPAYTATGVTETINSNAVHVGCQVTLRFDDEPEPILYRLIAANDNRSATTTKTILVQTPIGSAILGAVVGDTVTCAAPGGIMRVTIDTIVPDAPPM